MLGICLGHQGIGNLLDGDVGSAPEAMHGRLSTVRHEGSGLFAGVPQDFSVVRYHSLAITRPMGPEGRETAWADDGVVMGVEHRTRPMWGVQFHPESVATEYGRQDRRELLRDGRAPREALAPTARRPPAPRGRAPPAAPPSPGGRRRPSRRRRCSCAGASSRARRRPSSSTNGFSATPTSSFWLDSADAPTWLAQCSYMGTSEGPGSASSSTTSTAARSRSSARACARSSTSRSSTSSTGRLALNGIEPPPVVDRGLVGGFVGYLGYELKADCGATNLHSSDLPDAALMLRQPGLAVDHARNRRSCLFAVGPDGDEDGRALARSAAERRSSPRRSRAAGPGAAGAARGARVATSASSAAAAALSTSPTSNARRPNWPPGSPTRSA